MSNDSRHIENACDGRSFGDLAGLLSVCHELRSPRSVRHHKYGRVRGPAGLCKLRSEKRSHLCHFRAKHDCGYERWFPASARSTEHGRCNARGIRLPHAGGQAPIRFELRRVERWEDRFGREFDKRQGVLEHRFEFSALPAIAFSGTLTLPTLYLDGVAVESPSFKFDRRRYAGVAALNC